jgi:rRNA maturation endonuclease Nob1
MFIVLVCQECGKIHPAIHDGDDCDECGGKLNPTDIEAPKNKGNGHGFFGQAEPGIAS